MATTPQAATAEPAIQIEHLVKRFGSLRAVDDLTFNIVTGETFGLIGPNGSGKTTLIRLLLGLLAPTSGQVHALGRKIPNRRVATQIGYMTQSSALYNELSVRENLAFFGKLYGLRGAQLRARIEETLRLVDLSERIDAPVSTLSGGMRQRVSLASALIHQPRLLFLDEPTVGIDPELRMTFWNYFETLTQQGVTLVVSTHHMDEAKRCHRLALMRFGKLLAVDTPAALQAQSGEEEFDRAFLYFARLDEPDAQTA